MVKERKNLGLGLLPIAAVFLFNPTFAVLDVLPDIIGYLLLYLGLRALADMNYHIEDALNCFWRMIGVSALQLLSLFWLFGICTTKERPVAILLFSFTFGVFEILLLTKGFRELFEGLLYLGSRMEATAVFMEDKKKRSATSRIEALTVFFVVAKAVLTVLPEFASLTQHSYDSSSPLRFLYQYISLFRMLAVTAMLIIGTLWLAKFICYIRSILKDRPFMEALGEKYRIEVLPRESLFIRRAVQLGTVILCIALISTLDIYIDYVDFLPDFLCPAILLVGYFVLGKYTGKNRLFIPLAAANVLTSVIAYIATIRYYDSYSLAMIETFDTAYNAYIILCILKSVDALAFLAMMLSLRPVLLHIIENYTGFIPEDMANQKKSDKLAYVHGVLKKKIKVLTVLTVPASVSSVAYIILVRYLNFMWMIEFVFCLVLILYFISSTRAIVGEVEEKYMLS